MQEILSKILTQLTINNKGNLVYKDSLVIVTSKELQDSYIAINNICNFIYRIFYSKQSINSISDSYNIQLHNDKQLNNELSKIQINKMIHSKNWIIIGFINDSIIQVKKNNITLTINREIHIPEYEKSDKLAVGQNITVLFSCHFPNISKGFYVYKSDKDELNFESKIGRLYFNLNPFKVISFTKLLLDVAYKNSLVFNYKVFKNINNEYRVDSAVLYFRINDFSKLEKVLFPIIFKHKKHFNNQISEFHFPIFKGVGFAEEPEHISVIESYGLNRCRIISESIYDLLEITNFKTGELKDGLETIKMNFLKNNINKIYQQKGSKVKLNSYKP